TAARCARSAAPALHHDRRSALREPLRQLDPGLGHAFQGLGPRRDRRQLLGHELGGLLAHLMEVRQPHARHQPAQLLADGLGDSGRGISLGEEQSGAERRVSDGAVGALGLAQRPAVRLLDGRDDGGQSQEGEAAPDPDSPRLHERLMRLAAAAAPNPLSMFTTVIPDAQEFSIPSSAAIPPKDAPYPTLVGTAMTGTDTSPPTTLGRAPSIPATTMITAALRSASVWVSTRCSPAIPTSVRRATRFRSARAVTAASSATGRSLVPAVTMRIVPRPVGSGSG